MKYIRNYQDYLREFSEFNHQNEENMNEGIKHWMATFLMLVSLGIVPPVVMASSDKTKQEFIQSDETIEKVASKFEAYFRQNIFYNTPENAWEDFQKIYGNSNYDLNDILKKTSFKPGLFSSYEINTKIPVSKNYVNDYAELVFPQEKEDSLNAKISRYEKQSGMEIAIITVNTFGEKTVMSSFAQDVFENWGIGKSASNNGILIAISEKDRDWRIHTGYGAEIVLPDMVCSDLGEGLLVPAFKAGNYGKGIEDLVNGIMNKIGTNSEDIKKFQNDYEVDKAKHREEFKQGAITTVEIIGILSILGFLISVIVRRFRKDKSLKERSKGLLADINILMEKFKSQSTNPRDLEYLNNLKNEFENYINSVDDLPTKPTTNQESIDKLFTYNKVLGELIMKAEKFNRTYAGALLSERYILEARNYFNIIKNIENELSDYNVKSKNKITVQQVEDAVSIVKKNMGNKDIFSSVDGLTSLIMSIKGSVDQMKSTQVDISRMEIAVGDYDRLIDSWIKDLKVYGLDDCINRVIVMKTEFEKVLSLPKNELQKKYDKLREIERYAKGKIQEIEDGKRRKREAEEDIIRRREEAVRQEKREEDARQERRREESRRSDFGGYGGGHSGGGGAGGKW